VADQEGPQNTYGSNDDADELNMFVGKTLFRLQGIDWA
jgi:hypothetical protein